MKSRLTASALAMLVCGGCGGAGIDVMRYDGSISAMNGVPWNLGMTSFKVTITRRVTGCGDNLTGTVEAAVEPNELRVDPTQMFTLQSDGWWNKSSIKGSYGANGVSTGLNATSEGQAGVILSNVVGTIATLAPMAVAFAGDAEACRKEVVDALAVIADKPPAEDGTPTPSLKDVVKTQTRELAELTATVNRLSAQATALGPAATTEDRTAFRDAIKAMTDKTAELAANQQALDDALKAVTLVSEEVWPRSGDEFASTTPFRLDQKVFEDKWANVQRPELSVTNFDVYLDLRLKDAGAPGGGVQTVIDTARGIPVRFAQTGVVRVCATLACNAPGTKVVKSFEAPVLQLGRVVMVPVSGGGWRSTTAGVALDAGGNPTTIEMGNTVSVGESVTGFAARTATTLAALPGAISGAELARTQARTAQRNADTALLTAMAQGVTGPELTQLQAETALTNARTAQLAAQAALVTAQNAGTP
ncbi:MAG: hypothetical protein EPO54_08355 [Brevundimonas sp.]|jgi:hypothetical protein|nr:MAG: hypothetical protein EPO54_08355 [Brevundimonas sp.]